MGRVKNLKNIITYKQLKIEELKEALLFYEKKDWNTKSTKKALRLIEIGLETLQQKMEWVFLEMPIPSTSDINNNKRRCIVFNTKKKKRKVITFFLELESEEKSYDEVHREYRAIQQIKENSGIHLFCDNVIEEYLK